jgi:hypothetical protein
MPRWPGQRSIGHSKSGRATGDARNHKRRWVGLEPLKRDLYREMSELILTRNDRGRRR